MKIITGEQIQNLADICFSKASHQPFELYTNKWVDIDEFDPEPGYENPYIIYANSSLINKTKPALIESNFVTKLENFKNSFILILHNSDQNFSEKHLDIFDRTLVEKVYSQNVVVKDDRVIPLPIGLANSCWEWGNVQALKNIEVKDKKTKDIYFNFTVEGGARDEKRPGCYAAVTKLGIPWIEDKKFTAYLEDLNDYRYIVSPQGNGIDCHRTWEALYLKVIPIVDRNATTEFYSEYFPMFLVDDWNDLNLKDLEEFESKADWSNYNLLGFDQLIKHKLFCL